jgi:hypothetical protein
MPLIPPPHLDPSPTSIQDPEPPLTHEINDSTILIALAAIYLLVVSVTILCLRCPFSKLPWHYRHPHHRRHTYHDEPDSPIDPLLSHLDPDIFTPTAKSDHKSYMKRSLPKTPRPQFPATRPSSSR